MLSPREQLQAMGIRLEEMEAQVDEDEKPKFKDVPDGPELHRILNLARRPIPQQDDPETVELARFLTERLAKVPAPYPGPMRPIQALALKEAWTTRGLVAPIRVSGGKSLISFLLPVVLGAKRPLYVCPALMKPDIATEFGLYARDWASPPSYPIVSYQKIASPKAGAELGPDGKVWRASLLERLAPDLIVLDESHSCADSGTTTTKRIKAYCKAHPECVIVIMSGSLFKTSITDASHTMEWALGDRSPLPHDFVERQAWASYLDARPSMGPRVGVGALLRLLNPAERGEYRRALDFDEERRVVRGAIARRMLETPGVIGTQDPPLETGLTIEAWVPKRLDPALGAAFEDLREAWALPDGTVFVDGLDYARHCNTMGHGLWQKWDPTPPEEWREARNAWAKWCSKAIKYNRRGVDSEAKMKEAVRKGVFDDEGVLEAWESARDAERARTRLQEPPSVPQWVSDEAIVSVGEWVAEHQGLVWVRSIGLGERLSEKLRIPYYGAKGLDANGRHIKNHPGGPAIASMAANGTGRNLQKFWSKNLWLCAPNEQSLGRTHRSGQEADVVRNWIYLGCAEHLKQFWAAANQKARFAEEIQGSQQKLRYAQIDLPTAAELEENGGVRWTSRDP